VIRISGPKAHEALELLSKQPRPATRQASLRNLYNPVTGQHIDEALVIVFKGLASFTGEDVTELHLHGGRAVTEAATTALAGIEGLRLALPGEFTRRAFEHGKLDLTEAEAIADLVDAETEAQRLLALDQLGGTLSALYHGWAERLTRSLAHLEAEIDFPDEDLPGGIIAAETPALNALIGEIGQHLDDNRRGERLRDGISIAILGAPNAGKSSLLNAIAQRDAAIVSATAGTTRDVIEVHLDLGGYPVTLMDTAGLRETLDEIESEGIRRALARAEQADLKLLVVDGTGLDAAAPRLPPMLAGLTGPSSLIAINKVDQAASAPGRLDGHEASAVSALTGAGLAALLARLQGAVADSLGKASGGPTLTRARHREALTEARASLTRALTAPEPELAAEDVRLALRALGRITGRVDVEDLLDVIFRDFCIGK
jgi:tRNA modification GTPase